MTPSSFLYPLIENSAWAAVVVALVLIIRKPFARRFGARVSYLLWFAPAARLFLPQLDILKLPESPVITGLAESGLAPASAPTETISTASGVLELAAAAILFVWIAGAVAKISTIIASGRRLARHAPEQSDPAPPALLGAYTAICRDFGLRRPPAQLRVAHDASGPAIVGLFRPLIIVPVTFLADYTVEERRLALAHEISHLRRGDMATNFIAHLLLALQWPNPAAWFAIRAFRIDQEAACDNYVLTRLSAAPEPYARTILKAARKARPLAAPAISLGHPLKERIMLLNASPSSLAKRLAGGVAASALIFASLAATASYGFAQEEPVSIEETIIEQGGETPGTQRRILVMMGTEEEIVFDDMAVNDRHHVLEFEDEDGSRRVIRISDGDKVVRVYDRDGNLVTERKSPVTDNEASAWLSGNEDSEALLQAKRIDIRSTESFETSIARAKCVSSDGEGEPVMLEFREEAGDETDSTVHHTVICLSGDDSLPENRAAALEKAIDEMEKRAKKEEARRKKMIKALREQARNLED